MKNEIEQARVWLSWLEQRNHEMIRRLEKANQLILKDADISKDMLKTLSLQIDDFCASGDSTPEEMLQLHQCFLQLRMLKSSPLLEEQEDKLKLR